MMTCRFTIVPLLLTFKDEVNADLKLIYDKAGFNGLKLLAKKSQVIRIQRKSGDVPLPELFIGPDLIEVVPLVSNLTPVDHYKVVCNKIYSVLRSVKPHPRYTYFEVRKKLVM
jgi:hypothetical protein